MNNSWSLPLRKVSDDTKKDTSIIWNNVHLCYEQNLFGQVTSLSYSNNGNLLSCTSSNQVVLLRVPQSEGVVVNTQTEKKNYALNFRDDDKLFVQAVDQRVIVKSTETSFERQFAGHTRDVRGAIFLGRHNFVSASDDTTVRMWDLLSENELDTGRVHTDYVRSLENYTGGCFFSGSYDHNINLWDPRASFSAPILHTKEALSSAVECLRFIQGDNLLACGAGDQILLFDPRKSLTQPLYHSSLHTKTVVSLAYSEKHRTLLSSSLDNRVKMLLLDGQDLHCISTKKFNDPVTSVAVHPESKEYAVGCASGALQVFKLKEDAPTEEDKALEEMGLVKRKLTKNELMHQKMKLIQQHLKTYQYGKALKSALYTRQSDVIMSTIDELLRRGALHVALNNQNDRTVVQLLRFAATHVDKPQFTDTMIAVFEVILTIYSTVAASSAFLHRELLVAQRKVGESVAVLRQMEKTMGVMELLINCDNE